MNNDNGHTGYYVPTSHEVDAPLEAIKAEDAHPDTTKKEKVKETVQSLEEVEKALEVVKAFASRHWMPCLRDCCGDGLYKVEEIHEQLRKEQAHEQS